MSQLQCLTRILYERGLEMRARKQGMYTHDSPVHT